MSRPGSIVVGKRRLETEWWGPRPQAAPTLVLLHEGLGCVALWRDFPDNLAAATGFGVFAFSRFGYGRSEPVSLPRPLSYMHDEARDVLPRVLDAAGIERCVLVGHSDGASIAAIHAASARDARVCGLALIAPHFFVEDVTVASIAAIRAAYDTGDLRRRLARYHTRVDVAFRGWSEAWLNPGFRGWDITPLVPAIEAPMLLLQGSEDRYGTTDQLRVAERAARSPVRTVLLQGAEHSPHIEAPRPTADEVARFARSVLQHELYCHS
ncbi:MAG: alpha/beta hydrolase [Alphaproteobacteria bacterium]|nr:alpha/beta hydrolase [Alphaproteobacteria bacterium]